MKKTLITTSLIAAVVAMPAVADPTAQELLDQKTVTSKYYVDTTKQDIIPTDDVLLGLDGKEREVYVPALVATDPRDGGLVGNEFGIVDRGHLVDALDWGWSELLSESVAGPDTLVPTVRVVADAISDATATLSWNVYNTNATNTYSVTFVDDGFGNWPSADETKLIDGAALAEGLALKQKKIAAGTAGNVVTYTGTAGQVGSANVASDALYSNNTLYNGSDVANIAAVETKQDKMTCAGYLAGHENDEDYCWLYSVAETRTTCTALNQTCDPNNDTCCSGLCMGDKSGKYTCKGRAG